jgi:hypothetical protein
MSSAYVDMGWTGLVDAPPERPSACEDKRTLVRSSLPCTRRTVAWLGQITPSEPHVCIAARWEDEEEFDALTEQVAPKVRGLSFDTKA